METEGRGPILELLIQTDPEKTVELEGKGCRVRMIPFSGTATGPLFQGSIAPGAVDTQITNAAEVRHMSARYMLTGRDRRGQAQTLALGSGLPDRFPDPGSHPPPELLRRGRPAG